MSDVDLSGATLRFSSLHRSCLRNAKLNGADLRSTLLNGADLTKASLINSKLSGAELADASLNFTNMSNADLSWSHLGGASLCSAVLVETDFSGVDLNGATLNESKLLRANLTGAQLVGAKLIGTQLSGAYLLAANLEEAELIRADLSQTNLGRAKLVKCNFSSAIFSLTNLVDVDFSQAEGLDSARHLAPSMISVDTIYKSKGNIPEVFLRGCGVPEDFIKFIPSLVAAEPFQFYKCFISHSTKNHLFCDRLYADLQSKGVRCWYFPEDARWGRSVWGEIDKPIKIYDKLILVCSKQSLNSPAVLRELERALQREDAEGKHILFPIYIDMYLFNEWDHPRKADVIAIVAGNFCGWKDPAIYQENFDRLLRDLKASEE